MPPIKQSANARLGARRGQRRNQQIPIPLVLGVGLAVIMSIMLIAAWSLASASNGGARSARVKARPIPALGNVPNTVAVDIIKSLECDKKTAGAGGEMVMRRRLQAEEQVQADDGMDQEGVEMDDYTGFNSYDRQVTGRDLFCIVAGSKLSDKSNDVLRCDAEGSRREVLLDIWSSARTQMPLEMLKKVLDLAVEKEWELVNKTVNLWMPSSEANLDFYSQELSKEDSSVKNLAALEGPRGLFVDVGSGLGLSTLAVSLLYPLAKVFSIEPAMPSWLLQRISIACNIESEAKRPHPILSGVGAKADGMLNIRWSPSASERARAWSPPSEWTDDDIELTVRLRTLRSVLAEAAADADVDLSSSAIVLNLDCEGCEYNVVPAMKEDEFNKFDTIIGTTGVHWGYIPQDKLPSSSRGKKTHERLCSHYDFAKKSIECCDFPELRVKNDGRRVTDLLGDLCSNFTEWAEEKNLYTLNDDYGWTELTSMA